MDKSILEHLQEFKHTINRGVEPLEHIKLPTSIIKKFLGLYLGQSIVSSIFWAYNVGSFSPLFVVISAFLQVGWIWNKVTDSWKNDLQNNIEPEASILEPSYYEPMQVPIININNEPIVAKDCFTIPIRENTNTHPLI